MKAPEDRQTPRAPQSATGDSGEMAPVFGTSIVRAFGQVAGLTGLTEKLAQRLSVRVAAVRVP